MLPVTPCAVLPRPGEEERPDGGSRRGQMRLPTVRAPTARPASGLGATARVKLAALWAHWRIRPSRRHVTWYKHGNRGDNLRGCPFHHFSAKENGRADSRVQLRAARPTGRTRWWASPDLALSSRSGSVAVMGCLQGGSLLKNPH